MTDKSTTGGSNQKELCDYKPGDLSICICDCFWSENRLQECCFEKPWYQTHADSETFRRTRIIFTDRTKLLMLDLSKKVSSKNNWTTLFPTPTHFVILGFSTSANLFWLVLLEKAAAIVWLVLNLAKLNTKDFSNYLTSVWVFFSRTS